MLNGNLFKFTNSTYKYLGKQIGLNLNLKNNFALSPLYRRTYSKGEALSRSRSRDMSMVQKSFANLEPALVVEWTPDYPSIRPEPDYFWVN